MEKEKQIEEEEIRKRWKKEEEKMEFERKRWIDLGVRERSDALWWTPPPLFPSLRNAFRRCVRGQLEDEGEEGFVLGMLLNLKSNWFEIDCFLGNKLV